MLPRRGPIVGPRVRIRRGRPRRRLWATTSSLPRGAAAPLPAAPLPAAPLPVPPVPLSLR
eukprot:9503479-Pyramimonas_sp.AAC.1